MAAYVFNSFDKMAFSDGEPFVEQNGLSWQDATQFTMRAAGAEFCNVVVGSCLLAC